LKINYDLNETKSSYLAGRTILRVEGDKVEIKNILITLNSLGYKCEILEIKVCV